MFKDDALCQSNFVEIHAVYDREEVEMKIEESSIRSNRQDYEKAIKEILDFEDRRRFDSEDNSRKKIYAMKLKIQIPRFSTKEEQEEFVTKFMGSFKHDSGYRPYEKDIPYLYWLSEIGEGSYIEIMTCQRAYYEIPIVRQKTYQRNMYINSRTLKFTSKDDPDAIMKERGSLRFDKDGNPVMETICISPIKERSLNYYGDGDEGLRKGKFYYFVTDLKLRARRVIDAMCMVKTYLKGVNIDLKAEKFTQFDTREKKNRVLKYNSELRTIRYLLGFYANQLNQSKKVMIELGGQFGTKETFYWQFKEYQSLVQAISKIFTEKSMKETPKENKRLKKQSRRTSTTYDFSIGSNGPYKKWVSNFIHVVKVVKGMIQKFNKNTLLGDFEIDWEIIYKDQYKLAKEAYLTSLAS